MPPGIRIPNNFTDPAGNLAAYDWEINHTEQEGPSRPENVSYNGKAGRLGVLAQQGEFQPLVMELRGVILHRNQYVQFWNYHEINNSFYFTDYDGNEYEVHMTGLEMTPERLTYNPFDSDMRFHRYRYTMTLRVLNLRAGDLFDIGVPV